MVDTFYEAWGDLMVRHSDYVELEKELSKAQSIIRELEQRIERHVQMTEFYKNLATTPTIKNAPQVTNIDKNSS